MVYCVQEAAPLVVRGRELERYVEAHKKELERVVKELDNEKLRKVQIGVSF
jgi:ABC-type Fe3+-citrate transport system substrate-binding protein